MLGLELSIICNKNTDIHSDRRSEAFEMWICKRMEKISWLNKCYWWGWRQANTELYLAKETLMEWPCFKTWQTFAWNYWRQNERQTNKWKIWQNDDGYIKLKWGAQDREGWRDRERMSKTCSTAEYYWWPFHLSLKSEQFYCISAA